MTFFDAFSTLLFFLLIGASPRIWRKTVRRRHDASLQNQFAEVLRSMGSGGTSLVMFGIQVGSVAILTSEFAATAYYGGEAQIQLTLFFFLINATWA